ncbi:MAG: HyaD/HybD family hydrogenase maturation endopeptidase [Candidatus Zixiibacteriota bacterium]
MKKRILIAGIGNLLLTDEGVGVHVIRELSKKRLPDGVHLADIGTATFELVRLMEEKDKVVIVDAVASDDPPGTVYKFAPHDLKTGKRRLLTSLHQLGVMEALESASLLGAVPEVVIFGIAPKDYQTFSTQLTSELQACIPRLVRLILKELEQKSGAK